MSENPYESPQAMAKLLLDREGFPAVPKKIEKILGFLRTAQEASVRSKQTEMAKFWRAVREEVERERAKAESGGRDDG